MDKAYVDEKKVSIKPIEVQMNVRFKGIYRPLCAVCEHSIMSHGELNGRLVCWGCIAVRKICLAEAVVTIGEIIKEVLDEPTQASMCVK
jgi:hypothetical protein